MRRIVAVIGGGASGALVATQLLRRLGAEDEVLLIHPSPRLCLGVAYGTADTEHRLNVRGNNMSVFPDHPAHFVEWLNERQIRGGDGFVSRALYGEYLQSVLERAKCDSRAKFRSIVDKAESVEHAPIGYQITLGSKEVISATHVVLATGHLGPKIPAFLSEVEGHPRFIRTPWPNVLQGLDLENENVLIVGTGLTMVDTAITLNSRIGKGRIYARSRHGLLPQPHRHGPKPPVTRVTEPPESLRSLAHEVICQARSAGENWRGVVDGCRSRTEDWWRALSWAERERFLRRFQAYWDVHRHRVDEEIFATVKQMRSEGRLDIGAAKRLRVFPQEHGFQVTSAESETLEVGWIINCAGPDADYKSAKLPLLESLVEGGMANYDPLSMGLEIDQQHRTSTGGEVFAIGSLCRGCLWETSAIPEIRVQAELIATQCAES